MKRLTPLILAGLALLGTSKLSAQNEFYNDGAQVYVQAAGLIFVQGEVINDDQAGNIGRIFNSGDIQLTGNWTNTSTSNVFQSFDPGTTTFLGNNALQTIGGTTDTYFNNLTLNKPGGTREVRQLRDALADGVLALNDDFLNTTTFNFLVANPAVGAITRGGGNVPNYMHSTTQGYITSTVGSTGRLARATNSTGRYFFPVGTAARWRPVDITPGVSSNNVYSVQFVDAPTPNPTLKAPTLSTINPAWYHFIERALPISPTENIRIYHDFGPDDICDITRVTMAEWNTAIWDDLSPTTSSNPAPFMSWTDKIGYPGAYPTPWATNRFALAGLFIVPNVSSCVFPVELIYLTAQPLESSIMLDWETATETNNSGFEVHRSTDGIDFERVGWVAGAGNSSSPTPYNFEDRNVNANQRYFYRLRQLDFNGGETISNTVEAIIVKGQESVVSGFFPNPSNGNVHLWLSVTSETKLEIEVFNAIGQKVYEKNWSEINGYNKFDFNFSSFAKGSYIANVKVGNELVQRKLVIE